MVDEGKPHGDPNREPARSGPGPKSDPSDPGARLQHPLHPRRPPLNRRQLLMQVVVAGVILASGIGIGTGGTILALKNRIIPRVRWMPVDPPGPEPNFIVARWKGDYSLSDKQAQQVKDILTKQFTALRELRQKLFQAEQAERDKSTASMKKALSPEQYAKWDQDMKERARRFEQMRASRGPRGDHKGPPRGERGSGRSKDPNNHRWDGPPRPPMEGDGQRGGWPPRSSMDRGSRRGSWPPRGQMDPNNAPKDRPAEQPMEVSSPPAEANALK
jgi:hypothetical protein